MQTRTAVGIDYRGEQQRCSVLQAGRIAGTVDGALDSQSNKSS